MSGVTVAKEAIARVFFEDEAAQWIAAALAQGIVPWFVRFSKLPNGGPLQ